jgi:hypothetical protein
MIASFQNCETGTYRLVFGPLTIIDHELSGGRKSFDVHRYNSRELTNLARMSGHEDFKTHSFLKGLGGKSICVVQQTHAKRWGIRIALKHAAACLKYVRLEGEPWRFPSCVCLYFILFYFKTYVRPGITKMCIHCRSFSKRRYREGGTCVAGLQGSVL